jgi:hypothetical protein
MIFTHPRCLQCFPTQENLTTKTLNPIVPSFAVPSFSLFKLSFFPFKNELKHLNSTQTLSKSCHGSQNRDTVGAYDPRYDQPYPENVPSKSKIVSRFPKSCHDWTLCKTCSRHSEIVTRFTNRVRIVNFSEITIEGNFNSLIDYQNVPKPNSLPSDMKCLPCTK